MVSPDMSTTFLKTSALTLAAVTSVAAPALADDWLEHAANPVTNPIFFESAQIQSEVRPLFLHHRLDDGFVGGGFVNVYALQLRYAVNDRLAIIATKDGYIDTHTPGIGNRGGWADLAAGLKYALIKDDANQFQLTPGFTVDLPTGNEKVFQGTGKGEWNAFVSALKGFGDFHVSANVGARIPNDMSKSTASLHYSGQLDYYVCRWFMPFVSINAFTTRVASRSPRRDSISSTSAAVTPTARPRRQSVAVSGHASSPMSIWASPMRSKSPTRPIFSRIVLLSTSAGVSSINASPDPSDPAPSWRRWRKSPPLIFSPTISGVKTWSIISPSVNGPSSGSTWARQKNPGKQRPGVTFFGVRQPAPPPLTAFGSPLSRLTR